MNALLYEILLHWKLHIRNKEILVHFYIVPLIFYLFIGSIFTSINPEAYKTLIPALSIFGITMGGVLGSPSPLLEFYGTDIKKAYQIGHIPLWTMALGNFISGFLHLFLMSVIIFITAPLLFQAVLPTHYIIYFIGLSLVILTSLSVGMVFGLSFHSSSKMAMSSQLVFLPSIMLSGIMFPLNLLPDILQYLANLFPATWAFRIMSESSLQFQQVLPLLFIFIVSIVYTFYRLRKLRIE